MDRPMTAQIEKSATKPIRRITRWTVRSMVVALMGIGVFFLAQTLILPVVVRREVAKFLSTLNLRDVQFEVRHASPWSAEVTDIRAGNGEKFAIARIMVEYSPFA